MNQSDRMRASAEDLALRTLISELVASLPDHARQKFAARVAARIADIDARRTTDDTHTRCAIAREHVAKVLADV